MTQVDQSLRMLKFSDHCGACIDLMMTNICVVRAEISRRKWINL